MQKSIRLFIFSTLIAAYAGLSIFYIYYGDVVFPDEGFYLLAAQRIFEGQQLYTDFAYFQAPLMPYIYGLLLQVFGNSTVIGRWITSFWSLCFFFVFLRFTERIAGLKGMIFAGVLLIFSFQIVHVFTITAAYSSLSALLVMGGLYWLVFSETGSWRYYAAVGLFSLATLVRLTYAPFFLLVLFRFTQEKEPQIKQMFYAIIEAVLIIGVLGILLAGTDFEMIYFNNLGAHLNRADEMPLWWNKDVEHYYMNKINIAGQTLMFNFWTVTLAVIAWIFLKRKRQEISDMTKHALSIIYTAALIHAVVHILPKPTWHLYFLFPIGLLHVPIGFYFSQKWERTSTNIRKGLIVFLFVLVLMLNGFYQGGLYYRTSDPPHLTRFQQTIELLQSRTPEDGCVLSFMTPLVLDAGRDVCHGFEMTFFGYYPRWDSDRCQKYHIVNNDIILEYIKEQKPSAIVLFNFIFEKGVEGNPVMAQQLRHALNVNYELALRTRAWSQIEFWVYFPREKPLQFVKPQIIK